MTQRHYDTTTLTHYDSFMTRLIFGFLSVTYIAMMFLWADSSIVSRISPYNPYSLLHIPLYGVLTILLIFTFLPFNFKISVPYDSDLTNEHNASAPSGSSAYAHKRFNALTRLFVAGLIALIVAIADEYHQSFIPSRDASLIDVFLDFIGIAFVLFIIYHRCQKTEFSSQ